MQKKKKKTEKNSYSSNTFKKPVTTTILATPVPIVTLVAEPDADSSRPVPGTASGSSEFTVLTFSCGGSVSRYALRAVWNSALAWVGSVRGSSLMNGSWFGWPDVPLAMLPKL